MLEFKVLGPLEVWRDGHPVSISAHKQRSVLAVLLIARTEVVSLDRLIDELWGEEPPSQATASLQVYISNLRRVLEPERARRAPSRVLVSRPPGYALAVEPGRLDSTAFELSVEQGQAALTARRPRAARATLMAALALWRGPALAEFAFDTFAREEATRLDELRIVATEASLEAALVLGQHATAVSELRRLVAVHPFREGLWASLVLALYRDGRQGEALRACAEVRRLFGAELGLEPGVALRRLEANVLAQDARLEWHPVAGEEGNGTAASALPFARFRAGP